MVFKKTLAVGDMIQGIEQENIPMFLLHLLTHDFRVVENEWNKKLNAIALIQF